MEDNWTVYMHVNKVNNKKYIGITSDDPLKRWGKNGSGYLKKKNKKFCQPAMANAILKYGWDNFSHEILYTNLIKEDAEHKEQELIKKYKTWLPKFGYNIELGGIHNSTNEITRNKMSKSHIGLKHSEETKKKISQGNKGKIFSEDVKDHLSEVHSINKGIMLVNLPNNKTYNSKKCKCVETGIYYDSIADAAYSVGSYPSNIVKCLQGERKRAGGYHWEEVK